VNFANYDPDELVEILSRHAATDGYELAAATADRLREHFAAVQRDRTFGNARYARQLLESMITHQAGRLSTVAEPTVDDMRTLRPDDVPAARS
jgi:hypothetical protein